MLKRILNKCSAEVN